MLWIVEVGVSYQNVVRKNLALRVLYLQGVILQLRPGIQGRAACFTYGFRRT